MAESDIQRIARELNEVITHLPQYEDGCGNLADKATRLQNTIRELRDREGVDPEAQRHYDGIIDVADAIIARARNLQPYIHDTAQIGEAWSASRVDGSGGASTTVGSAPAAQPHTPPPPTMQWSSTGDRDKLNGPLPPNTTIVIDGRFTYKTDGLSRVVSAEGSLDAVDLDHPRDEKAQRTLVGKLPGDDAGHLIARIFGGPGAAANLTPMGRSVNRGRYKSLENRWRRIIESGGEVDVSVEMVYESDGARPDRFIVTYESDGQIEQADIPNRPQDRGTI